MTYPGQEPATTRRDEILDTWNERVPVGSPVRWRGIGEGDGMVTRTTSQAESLGDGTPVVWLEGVGSRVALMFLELISEEEYAAETHNEPQDVPTSTETPEQPVTGSGDERTSTGVSEALLDAGDEYALPLRTGRKAPNQTIYDSNDVVVAAGMTPESARWLVWAVNAGQTDAVALRQELNLLRSAAEKDICVGCVQREDQRDHWIEVARRSGASAESLKGRLYEALEDAKAVKARVWEIHAPERIYQDCGHDGHPDDEADDLIEVGTDGDMVCADSPYTTVCAECCVENDEQTAHCIDHHDHTNGWICDTLAALDGEETDHGA
jgi:hypothetical protein